MHIAETDRLIIRWFTLDDAPFIFNLLNEPSWQQYIGDMKIETIEAAQNYLKRSPLDMYQRFGFGLYGVEEKQTQQLIGMCGLIKREALADVDLGFALLSQFHRQGYTFEAATAVLAYAQTTLQLPRVVAITAPDNIASISLLEKLGFRFEGMVQPHGEPLKLYGQNL